MLFEVPSATAEDQIGLGQSESSWIINSAGHVVKAKAAVVLVEHPEPGPVLEAEHALFALFPSLLPLSRDFVLQLPEGDWMMLETGNLGFPS